MKSNCINSDFKIFIAVRMKSTRLPTKALLDICGLPLVVRLFQRLEEIFKKEDLVVCTSTNPQDDELEDISKENGIKCFRGSELDVMGRFIKAAQKFDTKTIARVTGDNPLTDPKILEKMVSYHINQQSEYTYTDDLPAGVNAEIIDIDALKRIHKEISDPNSTEYMTYVLKRPDKLIVKEYKVENLSLRKPEISLTVDNESDIQLIRRIYKTFNGKLPDLSKIIEWLDTQPKKNVVFVRKQDNLQSIPGTNFSFKSDS